MQLSDLELGHAESVLRNCEFEQFGMCSERGDKILAPVSAPEHLADAEKNPAVVALIAPRGMAEEIPDRFGLIIADAPLEAFFRAFCNLVDTGIFARTDKTRIGDNGFIHPAATIAERGVVIGNRVSIGPGAVIEPGTVLKDDVRIGPNCVIGGEGFEVREVDGVIRVIPHVGGVVIAECVELQASNCVSRALFGGNTIIGQDTKTDNLVHIAHNVRIGRSCRIAACAMIAGSTELGDDVWVGPSSTISNGLKIGDGAAISLGSVVTRDVPAGTRVTGNFAVEHKDFLAMFRKARDSE